MPVIYAFRLEFAKNRNGEIIYLICERTNRISNGNNNDILLFLSKMNSDIFKDASLFSALNEKCRTALKWINKLFYPNEFNRLLDVKQQSICRNTHQ